MAFTYKTTKEEEAAKQKQLQDEQNLRNYQTYTPGTYQQSSGLQEMWNNITSMQAPTWDKENNTWWNKLTDTMNAIENREKFSYDVNADALYQQYKDQHATQGKMAMMDTMGQASAMTGGYGNSYAQSVGQQAYQGYMQQLTDKIPELYQLAYDKYTREGDEMYNKLSSYGSLYNTEYGEHRDAVSDFNADRSHLTNLYGIKSDEEYGQWYDGEQMKMTASQQEYQKLADMLNISTEQAKYLYDISYQSQLDTYNTEYQEKRDAIADEQWQKSYNLSASQAGSGSGGNGGNSGSSGTYSNVLWYDTGTTDDNGNKIFRNSDGKTQSFGAGVNPYTGTTHPDAKKGTFSNGYQPDNIGGTKLKKAKDESGSVIYTSVTGKEQAVWQADGIYYIWRGDLNRYVEVELPK